MMSTPRNRNSIRYKPPANRPTVSSALRESIATENKRQENEKKQRNPVTVSTSNSDSVASKHVKSSSSSAQHSSRAGDSYSSGRGNQITAVGTEVHQPNYVKQSEANTLGKGRITKHGGGIRSRTVNHKDLGYGYELDELEEAQIASLIVFTAAENDNMGSRSTKSQPTREPTTEKTLANKTPSLSNQEPKFSEAGATNQLQWEHVGSGINPAFTQERLISPKGERDKGSNVNKDSDNTKASPSNGIINQQNGAHWIDDKEMGHHKSGVGWTDGFTTDNWNVDNSTYNGHKSTKVNAHNETRDNPKHKFDQYPDDYKNDLHKSDVKESKGHQTKATDKQDSKDNLTGKTKGENETKPKEAAINSNKGKEKGISNSSNAAKSGPAVNPKDNHQLSEIPTINDIAQHKSEQNNDHNSDTNAKPAKTTETGVKTKDNPSTSTKPEASDNNSSDKNQKPRTAASKSKTPKPPSPVESTEREEANNTKETEQSKDKLKATDPVSSKQDPPKQLSESNPKPALPKENPLLKRPTENANWLFYQNKAPSGRGGNKIEEMLRWKGDYQKLESNHRYIQWLFPLPEGNGMNKDAQRLFPHEAQAISDNPATHGRVLKAYTMMLDFYGMELISDVDGSVRRCKTNWEKRYIHLNKSTHNHLRISRIIKSLGELGYDRFQLPWVEFLFKEIFRENQLSKLRNSNSLSYWLHAIKDESEKAYMYQHYGRCLSGNVDPNYWLNALDSESDGPDSDDENDDVNDAENRDKSQSTVANASKGVPTKGGEHLKFV